MQFSLEYDDRIMAYVGEHPGAIAREVCTALALRDHAFAGALLKRLTDEGRLVRQRPDSGSRAYEYTVPPVPQAPVRSSPNVRREHAILVFLAEHPGATANEMAFALKVGGFGLGANLRPLIEGGVVVRCQRDPKRSNSPYEYSLAPTEPSEGA